jgi:hypothetical protein
MKSVSQNPTGFRPRTTSSFCFGKRTQNHVGRGMALRVPCAVHQHRRCANSLRSNSARLFPGVGCTARPCHQARGTYCERPVQLAEPVLSFFEGLKQPLPNLRSWLRSSVTPKAGLSPSHGEGIGKNLKEEVPPTPTRWRLIETGEGRRAIEDFVAKEIVLRDCKH